MEARSGPNAENDGSSPSPAPTWTPAQVLHDILPALDVTLDDLVRYKGMRLRVVPDSCACAGDRGCLCRGGGDRIVLMKDLQGQLNSIRAEILDVRMQMMPVFIRRRPRWRVILRAPLTFMGHMRIGRGHGMPWWPRLKASWLLTWASIRA